MNRRPGFFPRIARRHRSSVSQRTGIKTGDDIHNPHCHRESGRVSDHRESSANLCLETLSLSLFTVPAIIFYPSFSCFTGGRTGLHSFLLPSATTTTKVTDLTEP